MCCGYNDRSTFSAFACPFALKETMSNPKVSVILPVYNGENYLRFAIESVLDQTFQDFELIVVDDGSSDSTPEVARIYGDRLKYVRQDNTGVAGAFNHGLRLATGRYVSWLSHDDVFHAEKLERQVTALGRFTTPAVCYTDIQMIDSSGNVVVEHQLPQYERQETLRHVLTGGPVCSACYSLMFDRRCIDEVGLYSETWRYAQDVDMLSRLARRFPLVRVPGALMQVREHEQRGIRSKKWEQEVPKFFRKRIESIAFEELFPEQAAGATKSERSAAYRWLADTLAAQPYPIYLAAFSQYRRALREDLSAAALLLRRIARLSWLHVSGQLKHQR
jgi:glycosyltransferase involved in cell wall biosynthesis